MGQGQRTIWIQQDNAPAHISPDDPDFVRAADCNDGVQIGMYSQPPNSPDLNVLDLGLFAALGRMKYKVPSSDLNGLVQGVIDCYCEFDWKKIRNVWLTLQCVMNEVIEMDGGWVRKIPHVNKEKLEREGELMLVIAATDKARQLIDRGEDGVDEDMEQEEE